MSLTVSGRSSARVAVVEADGGFSGGTLMDSFELGFPGSPRFASSPFDQVSKTSTNSGTEETL
jgi:hypothetical protein